MKKSQRWRRQAAHGDDATTRAAAEVGAVAQVPARVRASWLSRNWRGIALDLAVVASNLFLLAPLERMLRAGGQDFLASGKVAGLKVSSDVGWLFLSVFASYAVGVYLKRTARQAHLSRLYAPFANGVAKATGEQLAAASVRLRRRSARGISSAYRPSNNVLFFVVCALLLFHFFIFLTLLIYGWQSTGLENFSPLFGSKTAGNTYFDFFVRFVVFIFILPLPTGLTLYSLAVEPDAQDSSGAAVSKWRAATATELLADLLIYFSVVVLTLVLNVLIAPRFAYLEGASRWTPGAVLASVVPLALAFSVFYLPPRLVYLADDYRTPFAWLTILLALLSLAYRTFFPGVQW
ncbi:MAG TPA: hypothetical protein VLJ61_15905 [Pyrinomonadaceae bacterium]|nr:hypothetical protein [Pyrinomonadaceae bacterium]